MVCGVISDIHANLEALSAVHFSITNLHADAVLCLGDLVGYGADPDPCVDQVLSWADAVVRGNHDKAVARLLSLEWFNPIAREAAQWTRRTARRETLDMLASLREGPLEVGEQILICHGTPMDEDRYMADNRSIEESFRFLDEKYPRARYCFHGHTHVPMLARRAVGSGKVVILSPEEEMELDGGSTYLINPGAVGQPRDGNARASFGILDTESRIYRTIRVAYGLAETQRKILAAGLPRQLAGRLEDGR